MNKDKWIAISLGFVMLFALAGTGFIIWRKSSSKSEPVVKKSQTSKVISNGSGLSVTNGDSSQPDKSQNLGESTTNKIDSSDNQKPNFTEYEKYKSDKGALFGDIKVGTGAETKAGDKVGIYYKGYLTNGQIFDNQWPAKVGDKPKTFDFVIGTDTVISGLQQGMIGMKAGGTRRIIVPPAAGYGDKGQGAIPPDSVLVFDVDLITISAANATN